MSNLGNFLSEMVFRKRNANDALMEESRKIKEADTVARAMYKYLDPGKGPDGSQAANPLGPKDQWDLMSAQDRVAHAMAFTQAETLKRARSDQQQQEQMRSLQIQGLELAMGADRALEDVVRRAGREDITVPGSVTNAMFAGDPMRQGAFPPIPTQATVPITSERLMQAVANVPAAVNSQNFDKVLRAMEMSDNKPTLPIQALVGGRSLLVNPRSGAFQDITPVKPQSIPEGFVALGATMDDTGGLNIRYGPPRAEGKALTQEEVGRITALNQAEMDLNRLEELYKSLGSDYGGPLAGRLKSAAAGGQNQHIAALQNAIIGATPNLARGVFREVGVLTDEDVKRYAQLLPGPFDTDAVRKTKLNQLRERIIVGRKEMVTSLKSAGRDVEGFSADPAGGASKRFDSEDEARTAGAQAGDIVELYDPETASYRRARLK
jgi:hypothetical protein